MLELTIAGGVICYLLFGPFIREARRAEKTMKKNGWLR